MNEQDFDRNEAATPFKLQKARQRGQVARSAEVASACAFLAAVVFLAWHGLATGESLLRIARGTWARAAAGDATALWPLAAQVLAAGAGVVLPLFLVLAAAVVAGSIAQTGPIFSLEPLQMDFERIHPATGLRRLLSLRTVVDGVRACLKLALLTAAAAWALWGLLPQFRAIAALAPAEFVHTMLGDLAGLGMRMAAALALLAAADLLYTRREFQRKMRMSHRELKEEYKDREGDPRIRSRLRELRREMLRRSRSLRNTRSADVVLTKPTHYARALHYVHGEMDAPRVVAKGAGQLAAAMREIAARHRIVVVQNPPLARRLFREAPLDAYLPADFHAEVARIIVWVFAMRRRQQAAEGPVA
jgi:flagellar biosynthetic protein FlhB